MNGEPAHPDDGPKVEARDVAPVEARIPAAEDVGRVVAHDPGPPAAISEAGGQGLGDPRDDLRRREHMAHAMTRGQRPGQQRHPGREGAGQGDEGAVPALPEGGLRSDARRRALGADAIGAQRIDSDHDQVRAIGRGRLGRPGGEPRGERHRRPDAERGQCRPRSPTQPHHHRGEGRAEGQSEAPSGQGVRHEDLQRRREAPRLPQPLGVGRRPEMHPPP